MHILHLTDLHFGQRAPRWAWSNVIQEFLDDLDHLLDDTAVDVLALTGDIAFSGSYSEYIKSSDLFDPLLAALTRRNPNLVIVMSPGNHDLERPDPSVPAVRLMEADPDFVVSQMDRALTVEPGSDYGRIVNEPFAAYKQWQSSFANRLASWEPGVAPGDGVAWVRSDELTLGMISLNTSLFHLRDGIVEGDLRVLPSQIDRLVEIAANGPGVESFILLTHHPAAWLDDASQRLLRDGLHANLPIGIHLFGHRHTADFISVARGGDPRVHHALQGRSFFGLEKLADGVTERLHGYSLLRIGRDTEPRLSVAPREARARPTGGVTFDVERSEGWFVPKGEEWTTDLSLHTQRTESHERNGPRPPSAPQRLATDRTPTVPRLVEVLRDLADEGAAAWPQLLLGDELTRLIDLVALAATPDQAPTIAEIHYIAGSVLLARARRALVVGDQTLSEIEADLSWSRDAFSVLSNFDRLRERSTDQTVAPGQRAFIEEWLVKKVADRAEQSWTGAETQIAARLLAAELEQAPDRVDDLAQRLLSDAKYIAAGIAPAARIVDTWAYGSRAIGGLQHVRNDVVFSFGIGVNALYFDTLRSGKELAEQIGVVDGFDLRRALNEIADSRIVSTADGLLDIVAECSDPATEVALRAHVAALPEIAEGLPSTRVGAAVADRLASVRADGVAPRARGDSRAYNQPVTRIQLDAEKIRGLLMGEQLYGQAHLAMRELYQNALDACRYRQLRTTFLTTARQGGDHNWTGEITLEAEYDENGIVSALLCADNGVGMTEEVIRKCYLHAGARFVETHAFSEEQAEWLRLDPSLRLTPNSTFGIGAFSYFMMADAVEVTTRPQLPDGQLGPVTRLLLNAGSSVARLQEVDEIEDRLSGGGTIVRLWLRPEFRSISRLQLGNFLDETVIACPFKLDIVEGNDTRERAAEAVSPEISAPHTVAWEVGQSKAWWRVGKGRLLADGIETPDRVVGLMVSLHGDKKPVLRVDRNAVVRWDEEWVLDRTIESAETLADWPSLSLAWLWDFSERYPVAGRSLFEALLPLRSTVPLGQSSFWSREVDLNQVGCFPGDRYLVREITDSRWESEYLEIEIPKTCRRTDRWGGLRIAFPACLRPWRRRVWLEVLPELFDGWDPDVKDLTSNRVETIAMVGANPVWEPEGFEGLPNPDPIDAILMASQPDILSTSFSHGPGVGHTSPVDVVALVHGAHRSRIPLSAAVTRLAGFVRFGLRNVPPVSADSLSYVPTQFDCKIVAALGRAWDAGRQLEAADLLQLAPHCQEEGRSLAEAVAETELLMGRLGVACEAVSGRLGGVKDHVPSSREVRFFGFGEYDRGRELRHGRGTRGALVRAAQRADALHRDLSIYLSRYSAFGMGRYQPALDSLHLTGYQEAERKAWSAHFDQRAPWIDEEVYRRGFLSEQPSSVEELQGHAVFLSALDGVPLGEALDRVTAFPGLSDEQKLVGRTRAPTDLIVTDADIELLRSRIGERSRYQDKRFNGIGQSEIVRRLWSPLELKAASHELRLSMDSVMERLSQFTCIGVELPPCSPKELEEHEFSEIETELITTKDRTLGVGRRLSMREGRVPIVEPLPALHIMRVSASEKESLGALEDVLSRLEYLGVRSGAAPLPEELHGYIPSRTETAIAARLRNSLPLALMEHAFSAQVSCGYVCDIVSPWAAWLLAGKVADVDGSLAMVRENVADFSPGYSDVSFYAAAASLGRSLGNTLDLRAIAILAAQANVSIGQAAERARRMEALLLADGIGIRVPAGEGSAARPDSRWVMIALPEKIISGSHPDLAELVGVDEGLRSMVRTTLQMNLG